MSTSTTPASQAGPPSQRRLASRAPIALFLSVCCLPGLGHAYIRDFRTATVLPLAWLTAFTLCVYLAVHVPLYSTPIFNGLALFGFLIYAGAAIHVFRRAKTHYQPWRIGSILSYLAAVALLIVGVMTARATIGEPMSITSDSMVPTYRMGENVVISHVAYGHHLPGLRPSSSTTLPEVGDIIEYWPPGRSPDSYYIRRVVAGPGDEVALNGGTLSVNGQPYSNEAPSSITWTGTKCNTVSGVSTTERVNGLSYSVISGAPDFGPILVPADAVFVINDNRLNLFDSRVHGPITKDNIVGKVVATGAGTDPCTGLALESRANVN